MCASRMAFRSSKVPLGYPHAPLNISVAWIIPNISHF